MSQSDLENKLLGMLYGGALGDALGCPIEFSSLKSIQAAYGEKGLTELLVDSPWTDDTQMAIAVIKGVCPDPLGDLDTIMTNIVKEFINWLDNPGIAPGNTCLKGVRALAQGRHWSTSGILMSKGCGSVMRSPALGFIYQNNSDKLTQIARSQGIATHGHPAAIIASVAAPYTVKLILDGIPEEKILPRVDNMFRGHNQDFDKCLERINALRFGSNEIDEMSSLGRGWVGDEAYVMSLYAFLRHPEDVKKCLRLAVNHSGDSDSIGCIAGNFIGVKKGFGHLPKEWLKHLRNRDHLDALVPLMLAARKIVDAGE